MLSNHPRRPAPQAASLRNLCVRRPPRLPAPTWSGPRLCRGASRGVTFVFPLNVLSLPLLTTNLFRIRTSMTPLPQPLYNPHLQARLGSAGNTGLITPVESALTKTGGGVLHEPSTFRHSDLLSIHLLYFHALPNSFALFCSYQKHNSFLFKQFRTLCKKHPGVGGSI